MEWNFDNVKYNGKDLDRVQVDGVTVWEKAKPKFYDYIEADGNSWIDTGLKGNLSTEVHINFTPKSNNEVSVFGAVSGNNDKCVAIARDIGSSQYLFAQFGSRAGTVVKSILYEANKNYDIILNNTSYIVNNEVARTFSDTNPFTTVENLLIGKIINFRKSNYIGLIYECTIKDNGTLVRDYKPCLYNGVAGLWDSVEGKFYGNANNTGTLTVGNDE